MAAKRKPGKRPPNKKHTVQRVLHPKGPEDFTDAKTGELLNPKHEMFTQMWVQTFDQEKALEAGGYKKPKSNVARHNQCRNILRREEVQLRVRSILKERVKDLAVTEAFVILKMMDVYEKAMEMKPIVGGEGEIVGHEPQDLRVAMQTLKELGVNLGMFQKKSDDRAGTVVINMNYGDDRPALPAPTVIQGVSTRLN